MNTCGKFKPQLKPFTSVVIFIGNDFKTPQHADNVFM